MLTISFIKRICRSLVLGCGFLWAPFLLAGEIPASWQLDQTWGSEQLQGKSNSLLGKALAQDADWLFISAPNANNGLGSVLAYQKTAGKLVFHSRINAPVGSQDTAWFGTALAVVDAAGAQYLAVSAPYWQTQIECDDAGVIKNCQSYHGKVYFYKLTAGSWQLQQQVAYNNNLTRFARMGMGLSVAGDVLLVETPYEGSDQNQPTGVGRVQMLAATGADRDQPWQFVDSHLQAVAHSGQSGFAAPKEIRCDDDLFGYSSASFAYNVGRQIFIGAPKTAEQGCGNGMSRTPFGAVYIYQQQADQSYQSIQVLRPPANAAAGSGFGSSVAVYEDVLAVGAIYGKNQQNNQTTGVVYIYQRDASNKWQLAQVLSPDNSSSQKNMGFGVRLALASKQLLISATHSNTSSYNNANGETVMLQNLGSVYYFAKQDQFFKQSQIISPAPIVIGQNQIFGDRLLWLNWTGQNPTPLISSYQAALEHSRGGAYFYKPASSVQLANLKVSNPILHAGDQFNIELDIFNHAIAGASGKQQIKLDLNGAPVDFIANSSNDCSEHIGTITCSFASIAAQQHEFLNLSFRVQNMSKQSKLQIVARMNGASQSQTLTFNNPPTLKLLSAANVQLDYQTLNPQLELFKFSASDMDENAKLSCEVTGEYSYIFRCNQTEHGFAIVVAKKTFLQNSKQAKYDFAVRASDAIATSAPIEISIKINNIPQANQQPQPPKREPKIGSFDLMFLCLLGLASARRLTKLPIRDRQ